MRTSPSCSFSPLTLKAIQPFAELTHEGEPAFRRSAVWRSVPIAAAIFLGVALLGPFVLTNWDVPPTAIEITFGIILFYEALPNHHADPNPAARVSWPREQSLAPSLAIALFPLGIPAIVTAAGIAAIAGDACPQLPRFKPSGGRCCTAARGDGAQRDDVVEQRSNSQAWRCQGIARDRMRVGGAPGIAGRADSDSQSARMLEVLR